MPPGLIYYYLLLLVCALTGSILMRRGWPLWFKMLVVLSWVTLVAENMVWVCAVIHVRKEIYFACYALWIFLESSTLVYILSREAVLPWVRRLHSVLMIIQPAGVILYFILWPPLAYFGLFYLFLELVASGAVLIDILVNVSDIPMFRKPMFWLATGLLVFCSLYIVICSLGRLLSVVPNSVFWWFGCFANTFMYGGFIGCFIVLSRRRQGSKTLQE